MIDVHINNMIVIRTAIKSQEAHSLIIIRHSRDGHFSVKVKARNGQDIHASGE